MDLKSRQLQQAPHLQSAKQYNGFWTYTKHDLPETQPTIILPTTNQIFKRVLWYFLCHLPRSIHDINWLQKICPRERRLKFPRPFEGKKQKNMSVVARSAVIPEALMTLTAFPRMLMAKKPTRWHVFVLQQQKTKTSPRLLWDSKDFYIFAVFYCMMIINSHLPNWPGRRIQLRLLKESFATARCTLQGPWP